MSMETTKTEKKETELKPTIKTFRKGRDLLIPLKAEEG